MSAGDKGGSSRMILSPMEDIEDVFRHIETRLSAVERGLTRLETDRAISEERRKFMEERFNKLDTRLDRIDGHITRLVWLIIAAILGGFMSFVLRGALVNV